jgi:hypothetical protein
MTRYPNTAHGRGSPTALSALESFIIAATPGTITEFAGTNIGATETSNYAGDDLPIMSSFYNKPMTDAWHGKMCYDAEKKRISVVGTAAGYSSFLPSGERTKAVHFDMMENTFSVQWNPTGVNGAHIYDGNTSIAHAGFYYRREYNTAIVRRMNTTTKAWETSFDSSGFMSPLQNVPCIELFPDMYSAGALCTFGFNGEVWTTDLSNGTTDLRSTKSGITSANIAVYLPNVPCIIFGGGGAGTSLYKLNSDGTVDDITQTYPANLNVAANFYSTVAHPDGATGIITYANDKNEVWQMTLAGAWSKIADPGAVTGRMTASVVVSLHGLGATVLWDGRSPGNSKFFVHKV